MSLLTMVCSISLVCAAIAWRRVHCKHLQFAIKMLCLQLLILPVAVAIILPVMYPVAAFVPLLAVTIHMPLLTQQSLVRLAIGSGISTMVTVLSGLSPDILPWPHPSTSSMNILVVCGFVPVISLNYILFAQFKHQLVGLVDRLRTANETLETTVQQRTAELQQTLAYLDAANESLRDLALRDQLTGLFNRRYADETLEIEIYRAQRSGLPIGVMLIDLDHFKQVNDTYGHDAGDTLLRAVAALLEEHVRSGDIVARHGGEEFFMMLPGIPLPPLEQRGEMICEAIRGLQVTHNGQDLGMRSCSIGIAAYPTHGRDSTGLVKAADQALYQAKAAGRDRVVVANEAVAPLDADVWSLISLDQPPSQ
ncbi:MAG: GGDEF domain-containing protein [Chloroflexota bacterium]